jgi:hypothetical protein
MALLAFLHPKYIYGVQCVVPNHVSKELSMSKEKILAAIAMFHLPKTHSIQ